MKHRFIVIDDSELDCFIAEKMIKHTIENEQVIAFTEAARALEYITQQGAVTDQPKAILLLDVLMPVVSGFDFVEAFEQLPPDVQRSYLLVALTSTMNKNDLSRISGYKSVKHLLDKPITAEALLALLGEIDATAGEPLAGSL
ncbi:response regulator [Hufsiella ginkgonis]|uniref:Response regulator n=1 Tax=Hufsiella ginkgonis TaxID=2695274 RepID=A0A7K1XTW1_9SPHI|nr:response regulator [Hufsiella ginkgonis]MXV14380.1 response regulator [Hufsiella ginkgonis]